MDVQKVNRDLKISMISLGEDNVTWSTNPSDRFIIIKELKLPNNISPSVTSVKIPIPPNLYDPAKKGEFHYYQNIFVDPGLQVRYPDGSWGAVPRHNDAPAKGKNDDGWRFLCVYPKGTVNERTNISYFIRLIQVWFKNCLKLN